MRTTFDPSYTTWVVEEPDVDPVGSSTVAVLAGSLGVRNLPIGTTPPAFGPTGDRTRTFSGDLGALQGMAKPVLRQSAPGLEGQAAGQRVGLPISKIPSSTLVEADPYSVQAQFGVR